jgi:cellulose synthase/poly-beta-1,6-N-acetylglucosamine synthase-like glycosyltransferase
MELPALQHRKSEALNRAWLMHGTDADIVICHDADTWLPPTAFADWEQEFRDDEYFGGSTSKFTVQQKGFLGRLQKVEYSSNIQMGLDRGWTNVLAGAGAAFSGAALRLVASRPDRVGPWSYDSAVEDYELTYRIRELGFRAVVSPTVRAYTDGMASVRALWNQRMKWQTGTLRDLLRIGWTPLSRRDWLAQAKALVSPLIRILWVIVMALALSMGSVGFAWWGLLVPLLYIALNLKTVMRVPHRDWVDVAMAVAILPMEFLQCIQGGWIFASWGEVFRERLTSKPRDLWAAQYKAEGV